jgi:hypothetical protein
MARQRKAVDEKLVERLAAIGCTDREIATLLEVSENLLRRRCRAALDRGRTRLKKSLRRKQIELAKKGNVPMLIWLGKQYLDQRDRQDVTHSGEEIKIVERIVTDRIDGGPG